MTCVHLITSCCSSNIIDIQQRTPFALYWAAFVKLMPLTIGGAKDQGCHAEGRGCHDRFSAIARPAKLLPHCVSKCLDCFHSWSWCLDDKNRGIWTQAVPGIASLDQISFLDRSGFRYTFPRMLKSVTVKPEFWVSVSLQHTCFKGTLKLHDDTAHVDQLHIAARWYMQQKTVVPDCQFQHQQLRQW